MNKYLREEFTLHRIQTIERGLQHRPVVAWGDVQHVGEAARGVVHEEFGILQFFGVACEAHVYFLRERVDPFERDTGVIVIAACQLPAGDFRKVVYELRVKEALFSRLGGLGTSFQLDEGTFVQNNFVDCSVSAAGSCETQQECEQGEEAGRTTAIFRAHSAPRSDADPWLLTSCVEER
jgi:hypothetical protein